MTKEDPSPPHVCMKIGSVFCCGLSLILTKLAEAVDSLLDAEYEYQQAIRPMSA